MSVLGVSEIQIFPLSSTAYCGMKNSSQIIHDLEDNGFISPTGTSNAALATQFLQFNYTREKSPVYEPMEPGRFLYA